MWSALTVTALAGLSTGLGGLLALLRRPTERLMALSMGFAAGVMLTVSLADMLPGSMRYYLAALSPFAAGAAAASLLAMGMLIAALLERCLPEETAWAGQLDAGRARALRSAMVTGLALLLHNLPEGILTLFAGVADPQTGLRMALAIALHNLPEGIAVAVPLYYAAQSKGRAAAAAFASGLAEPLGAVLAWTFLHPYLTDSFLNGLMVLIAGVMSWVSVAELLPSGFAFGKKTSTALGFGLGMLVMIFGISCLS